MQSFCKSLYIFTGQCVDPLSQFIEHLSPKCEVFADVKLKAPWGFNESKQLLSHFSYLKSGRCFLTLDNENFHRIDAGTLVFLPYGDAHSLMSSEEIKCSQAETFFAGLTVKDAITVFGGDGAESKIMCGGFAFSAFAHWPRSPLMGGLPALISLDVAEHSKLAWLLDWLYQENSHFQAGSAVAISRLLGLLLLEILRSLDVMGIQPRWLSALQDRFLAPAVIAILKAPQKEWTLENLAKQSSLSRSAFSHRFKSISGCSPIKFLQQFRCSLAASQLVEQQFNIQQIAAKNGFKSTDVFIRNFTRLYQLTPKQYRLAYKHN